MRFLFLLLSYVLWLNLCLFGIEDSSQNLVRKLISNKCHHITEINREVCGFSEVILSSLAYNASFANRYLSVSSNSLGNRRLKDLSSYAKDHAIAFCFWQINESYIEIEPTDLLIINSLETYHHIDFALNTFAKNVHKYICIPNMYKTGVPFEREEIYNGDYLEYPNPIPKLNREGVWQAVTDFLNSHPEWELRKQKASDMLVLLRSDKSSSPKSYKMPYTVDYYLKNKIILCTGPSLGRYEILKKNIETEFRLIPYKKIFIRTNDDKILDIKFSKIKSDCKRIPCIEKNVDCWNCIITSIKDAINDSYINDDDIILFKHESVFLNDLGLFKRAINKMLSGYDMIVRTYLGGSTSDIFLVKVSAIKKLISNFSPLEQIPFDSFVEMMLHTQIVAKIPNVYCIHLGTAPLSSTNISTWGSNGFGFYHSHRYFKFSKSLNEYVDSMGQKFWKKENYFSLFEENYNIFNHKYYSSLSKFFADLDLLINNNESNKCQEHSEAL